MRVSRQVLSASCSMTICTFLHLSKKLMRMSSLSSAVYSSISNTVRLSISASARTESLPQYSHYSDTVSLSQDRCVVGQQAAVTR